jgi:hypothetical protein
MTLCSSVDRTSILEKLPSSGRRMEIAGSFEHDDVIQLPPYRI